MIGHRLIKKLYLEKAKQGKGAGSEISFDVPALHKCSDTLTKAV